MDYGIKILEEDGSNFTDFYSPYNIVDKFTPSGSGSKAYTLAAGESLYIFPDGLFTGDPNANCMSVKVSGGTVTWQTRVWYSSGMNDWHFDMNVGQGINVVKRR